MKLLGKEEKVGLLVIMALISLTYLTFKAGNLSLRRDRGTVLFADFKQVHGLDKGAQVRIAGVEAGRVKGITLKKTDGKPRLSMEIFAGIKVQENTRASIQSQGFMGEKYVELMPGEPGGAYLPDGGYIKVSEDHADFDQLAQQVSVLVKDLKEITGAIRETIATPEGKMALKESFANLKASTALVKDFLEQNTQQVQSVVGNFQEFTANLNNLLRENKVNISSTIENLQKLAETLREKAPVLADQVQSTTGSLQELISENRDGMREGVKNVNKLVLKLQGTADYLNSVLASIDEGEGTLGKLVKDDALYNDLQSTFGGLKSVFETAEAFRLYLGYRVEYFTEFEKSKSYISIKLQPKPDKYYLLEVIDDFRGLSSTKETNILENGNLTTTEEEITEDKFKLSLQIAKRFHGLVLRGGLIESKGGVGLDYFFMKDKFQLHFDVWDFTAEKPHLKCFADYRFGKYFLLNTGVDHLVDSDSLSYFFGAGFSFEDQDLKYLLSKIPIPGL